MRASAEWSTRRARYDIQTVARACRDAGWGLWTRTRTLTRTDVDVVREAGR